VLITDHDDWPAAEVIAAYRSQSEASSTGGRPRVRRMTTELTSQQRELHELFCLQRSAPRT